MQNFDIKAFFIQFLADAKNFFKRVVAKENRAILIWMIINCVLTLGIFFIPSVLIALSPIGEWYLRFTNNCVSFDKKLLNKKKKAEYKQIRDRIYPLFEDVYAKAKRKNPELSDKIKLFVTEDQFPNAFATGRHTICVTTGLLALSDDEIKSVMAHEFGHVSNKDTDILAACLVGNLPVILIITLFQLEVAVACAVIGLAFSLDDGRILNKILQAPAKLVKFIWNKLAMLCVCHSGKQSEYNADNFAVDIGYGRMLCATLLKLDSGSYEEPKGFIAELYSTHPATPDRVNSMRQHMAVISA